MIAYKLLRQRKDGTLGPLFINRRLRVPVGKWLQAEYHPTKGYVERTGWHTTLTPNAPHLKMTDRVWAMVEIENFYQYSRPVSQGGIWYIAQRMRVLEVLTDGPTTINEV